MTEYLEWLTEKAKALSEEERESIGSWILAEIEYRSRWNGLFSRRCDALERLADTAIAQLMKHSQGPTT